MDRCRLIAVVSLIVSVTKVAISGLSLASGIGCSFGPSVTLAIVICGVGRFTGDSQADGTMG